MTNTQGPWGGGDSPWGDSIVKPKKAKVINMSGRTADNNNVSGGGFGIKPAWVVLGILLLWLATGFYQVNTYEQGVILRFGKYVDTTDPGLHYKFPFPIETVEKVDITTERSINLGVGSDVRSNGRFDMAQKVSHNTDVTNVVYNTFTDSHMLTGDENIVDINLTVVWKVKDAKDYLFSMRDPDKTVTVAAQSVLREIVGQSNMQDIITGDRGKVEDETNAELQQLLDDLGSGVTIVRVKLQKADPPKQVVDAFNEVQRAKADMERFKNEAEAYRNEILPKARGEAQQRLQNAEAYKEAAINKAQGEADRFVSVYNAYIKGKDVTAKRLYIEAMENVLQNSSKTIVDMSKGSGVLPILPLKNSK